MSTDIDTKTINEPIESLDTDSDGKITLLSKNGGSVETTKKYAYISNLVQTSLSTDHSCNELPLPGVKTNILEKICEYMEHHKGTEPPIIEKPLRSKVMKDVCKDSWDAEFIDKIGENRQELYDLILAANYLDIKSLLHLG